MLALLPGAAAAQEDLLAVPLSTLMNPVRDEILPMERCAGLLLSLIDPERSDRETVARVLAAERMITTAERLSREIDASRAPGAIRSSVETYAGAYRDRAEAGRLPPPGDRAICEGLMRER